MASTYGIMVTFTRTPRNVMLAKFYTENVFPLKLLIRFLMTYLPIRAKNGNAQTSVALDIVASAANIFLARAAQRRGEEFIPWDADDVAGVCINLIDQVYLWRVNSRDILKDISRWDGGYWCWHE